MWIYQLYKKRESLIIIYSCKTLIHENCTRNTVYISHSVKGGSAATEAAY